MLKNLKQHLPKPKKFLYSYCHHALPCARHSTYIIKFEPSNTFFMEDQSRLSANRRRSMQLFILNSLITDIKKGKRIDFSQIPAEIIELLREETAKNQELKAALESRNN